MALPGRPEKNINTSDHLPPMRDVAFTQEAMHLFEYVVFVCVSHTGDHIISHTQPSSPGWTITSTGIRPPSDAGAGPSAQAACPLCCQG